MFNRPDFVAAASVLLISVISTSAVAQEPQEFRLASFRVDVTIPLDHRCMGILPTRAQRIVDPLEACGFVLLGADKPIVLTAVDWCEIRNGAYHQWREALAEAAGTTRERVLVSSLHQHDAPVVDSGAQELLNQVGLAGELYDANFHDRTVRRVADALKAALEDAQPVTHIGVGEATVEKVASNRRFINDAGRPVFSRGSSSGGNVKMRTAPVGLIDPQLKTISFWNGDQPLVALHSYSTHPMSYYGRGGVSADFVGMARRKRQKDDADVMQIYVSGTSGDTTAGKFNDGAPDNRPVLADRLYEGMKAAWKNTVRSEICRVSLKNAKLELPWREGPSFERKHLEETIKAEGPIRNRILAAMALSSLERIERGQPIDLPAIRIDADGSPPRKQGNEADTHGSPPRKQGDDAPDATPNGNRETATPETAFIVLFPAEAFVGYQLMAQQMRPDAFVLSIGYGECWPGYIPTDAAFSDNFTDTWLWVAPGCETRIQEALKHVLYGAVANRDD